jgi:acylaminoacyl-peptidase
VNYRGSTGFGETALQSLPGNIGRHDVSDMLAAVDAAVAMGVAREGALAVVGGSHGGFLAAHLIGQAPLRFRTAVLRNPVGPVVEGKGCVEVLTLKPKRFLGF